jgi:hypothetical protein
MLADVVARLERGEELRERTLDAIYAALEAAGVEFMRRTAADPGTPEEAAEEMPHHEPGPEQWPVR